MTVLVLQALTGLFALIFGVVAFLVSRSYRPEGVRRVCWLLTGAAFTFFGVLRCGQQIAAARAFLAGRGSEAWDTYLLWAPAMNHARGFLILAFILLLGVLGFLDRAPARACGRLAALTLVGATFLGAWSGWREGRFVEYTHYAALAVADLTIGVALAVALVIHLARGTMDRILWLCLCVYGVHVAMAVIVLSAFAWIGVEGMWVPSMVGAAALDLATAATMTAIAGYALVLTRRGVYIPALLEHPQPLKTAALP